MNVNSLILVSFLFIGSGDLSAEALASPVIQKLDRLEVNWSTLRIRFYGESQAGKEISFKEAEKRAWRDGLQYANDAVRDLFITYNEPLFENPETLSANAAEAAQKVSTSTFSYNTTYFGNGGIRVYLENLLAKAVVTKTIRFRQKEALEPGMIQYTGVVLDLEGAMEPTPIYQVVDEAGEVLFDVSEMAEGSFAKNLMGRWFVKPRQSELAYSVGNNPVRIKATVKGSKTLVVPRTVWAKATEGHKSLLRSGRIALSLKGKKS